MSIISTTKYFLDRLGMRFNEARQDPRESLEYSIASSNCFNGLSFLSLHKWIEV